MSKYSVEIVKPTALSQLHRVAWSTFKRSNPALYSPYFHLDYTQAVNKIRDDVHILVVYDNAAPIAFLPFQAVQKSNGRFSNARPIGAPMTDYHGVICAVDTLANSQFNLAELMGQAGIGVYNFSANIHLQNDPNIYRRQQVECTVMDIKEGANAWREGRTSSYRRHLKSTRRRIRKSEELGSIKYIFNCKDQKVFDQLILWKRQKFAQTGKYDVLSTGWAEQLLHGLWQEKDTENLRADMHVLYFGDQLAAIDLGLTDGKIFHSWMVAYNSDMQHLAPGIQLLEALIDQAGTLGYDRLDLGEGIDGYKRHYASENVSVHSGHIAAKGGAAIRTRLYAGIESFAEEKLGKLGKAPGKLRRRTAQIYACEPHIGGRVKALIAAFKGAPS